jgi:hypothetical protein
VPDGEVIEEVEVDISVILTAIGRALVDAIPSMLGSLVSLRFIPNVMSRSERLFALCCSYATGTYLGRGFAAYLEIHNTRIEDMIVFSFAIFGLSFISAVLSEMKPIIRGVATRWIGKSYTSDVKEGSDASKDAK